MRYIGNIYLHVYRYMYPYMPVSICCPDSPAFPVLYLIQDVSNKSDWHFWCAWGFDPTLSGPVPLSRHSHSFVQALKVSFPSRFAIYHTMPVLIRCWQWYRDRSRNESLQKAPHLVCVSAQIHNLLWRSKTQIDLFIVSKWIQKKTF